jgi:DNA-binding NarL/FixJ family response regulator
MAPIKVLLVDGQALFREGLSAVLTAQGSFAVVGDAGDAATGARLATMLAPDVIVTDLVLPDARGAEAVACILQAQAGARILIFTGLDDEETVSAAIAAGAQGYVLKHRPAEDLFRAIREVAAGGTWLDPAIVPIIWRRYQQLVRCGQPNTKDALSAFEQSVLTLMAAGRNTRQIAEAVSASPATIERTIGGICAKLGARNRAHAVVIALSKGLIQAQDRL